MGTYESVTCEVHGIQFYNSTEKRKTIKMLKNIILKWHRDFYIDSKILIKNVSCILIHDTVHYEGEIKMGFRYGTFEIKREWKRRTCDCF